MIKFAMEKHSNLLAMRESEEKENVKYIIKTCWHNEIGFLTVYFNLIDLTFTTI